VGWLVVWMVGLADGLMIDINDGGKLCEKALLFSTHNFLPIFSTTNHRLTQSTRLTYGGETQANDDDRQRLYVVTHAHQRINRSE
jgi:hypothetical protein